MRAALAGLAILATCGTALAQSAPSAFTTGTRYDAARRVVGTISADPDGAGGNPHLAVRNTYDDAGRLIRIETGELADWKPETVEPKDWGSSFIIRTTAETSYDAVNRKLKETVRVGAAGSVEGVTQYSYDAAGRLECTAVRMNPAVFGSLPASACTHGTAGSAGPDRITRNHYDAANQLVRVEQGVGTDVRIDYTRYEYTLNGQQKAVIDANGNRAEYAYDGLDRRVKWTFPSKTVAGQADTSDYEEYGYDANGNRTSLRKRDGRTITHSYDVLNRAISKTYPSGGARPVYYAYDLRGLQIMARFDSLSGQGITNVYDGFGRLTATTAVMPLGSSEVARNLNFAYDANGNRVRITHPDGQFVNYHYDGLDRLHYSDLNWSATLFFPAYDAAGRVQNLYRSVVTPWNWAAGTNFNYDGISRLSSYETWFPTGVGNVGTSFTYNPASQIVSRTRNNVDYEFTNYAPVDRAYARNGLNQYASVAGNTYTYDANGNLTSDGGTTYTYDIENRLVGTSMGVTLSYDPLGRLAQVSTSAGATAQFLYDGDALVAEYDGTGAMTKRYVHGPAEGQDDPMVEYVGSSVASPRYLFADHQGSIIAIADANGNRVQVNSYDEYGIPGAGNAGRFQYTGQAWLPELGMYHYKARVYSPMLGRFLQTDPIGYDDQMNLYAYTANDPMNNIDPGGDRFITAGEERALKRRFGAIMDAGYKDIWRKRMHITEVDTPSRPVSWGNSITMPRSLYSDDYSKTVSKAKVNTFFHEFYHEFEYRVGISTPSGLFLNQLKHGFDEVVPYKFDENKTFFQNNPEARASYFANCMTGGSCSSLNGVNERVNDRTTIQFKNGMFHVFQTETGSKVPKKIN